MKFFPLQKSYKVCDRKNNEKWDQVQTYRKIVNDSIDYRNDDDPAVDSTARTKPATNNARITNKIHKFLVKAICENEFLGNFEIHQVEALVSAMYPLKVAPNTRLIQEDEYGSKMYVSAKGTFDVYENAEYKESFGPGKVFGELALLYNAKRTFSVDVRESGEVWVLERPAFRIAMAKAVETCAEDHIKQLKRISILKDLPTPVLCKISDLIRVEFFPANTYIVHQGEPGDKFYIINGGSVRITKSLPNSDEEELVVLKKGDYFGEKALYNDGDHVRQANAIALQPGVECFTIDRCNFLDYLGEINSIRNKDWAAEYAVRKNCTIKWKSTYPNLQLSSLEAQTTLGIGSFGRVELVTANSILGMSFALKKIKKHCVTSRNQAKYVLNEKKIMQMCNSPFICRLYQTYKDSKYVYLLMEACLGGNLFVHIQRNGSMDNATSKFSAACIVEALDYLHQCGIVYRDLKPDNVMINNHGYLKLTDFGSSKIIDMEKTKTFVGTPEYMAPEIVLHRPYNRAVDFWSLGILVYETLLGHPPFQDRDIMKLYNKIVKGINTSESLGDIKKNAEDFIRRLLKTNPVERLGYLRGGVADIRLHKWFGTFEWQSLRNMQMLSPITVKIKNHLDTKYFEDCPFEQEYVMDDFSDWDKDF